MSIRTCKEILLQLKQVEATDDIVDIIHLYQVFYFLYGRANDIATGPVLDLIAKGHYIKYLLIPEYVPGYEIFDILLSYLILKQTEPDRSYGIYAGQYSITHDNYHIQIYNVLYLRSGRKYIFPYGYLNEKNQDDLPGELSDQVELLEQHTSHLQTFDYDSKQLCTAEDMARYIDIRDKYKYDIAYDKNDMLASDLWKSSLDTERRREILDQLVPNINFYKEIQTQKLINGYTHIDDKQREMDIHLSCI